MLGEGTNMYLVADVSLNVQCEIHETRVNSSVVSPEYVWVIWLLAMRLTPSSTTAVIVNCFGVTCFRKKRSFRQVLQVDKLATSFPRFVGISRSCLK